MPWENDRPTHVPTKVREACLARDGHQCTAALVDGTRCPATTDLQAAHLTQWTPGERTTVDNVRTLCHWHHNRETQQQAHTARTQAARRRPSAFHPREQHPGRR